MLRFRFILLPITVVAVCLASASGVHAQQTAGTVAITQGFKTQGTASDFTGGALVSTTNDDPDTVELATSSTANRLVGVVSDQALVALSNGTTQAQVVTSGGTEVLVSDINGNIHAGDKITASPIEGVGMLATGGEQVIGTAQADLNTVTATTQTVTDRSGKDRSVHIGLVALQVSVSYYQAPSSGFIPPFVQGFADNIAGRSVSLIRIAVCTILLLLAFVTTAALLYTSVRSGLISIGRNPLAAGAIRRGLLQIGVAIVLILSLVLLASYIILTV